MIVGIDASGQVLLVTENGNISSMPTTLNGVAITAIVLNDAQEKAYKALPSDRAGTLFDGKDFTAIPATQIAAAKPLPSFGSADDLAGYLRLKRLI